MKYYDILWTGKDDIDKKIRSTFIHIKLEINIGLKKETIDNKWNMPRAFWIMEKEKNKFNEILKLYPDISKFFLGHLCI